VRFSEDTPAEQARARTAVADWCQRNRAGTVEDMIAAVGPGFHKDDGPLLRVAFHRIEEQRDRQGAGTSLGTAEEEPASTRAGGSPPVNATAGVNGLPAGCAGDGGASGNAPSSPRGGTVPC
jgi:hypothetical protein